MTTTFIPPTGSFTSDVESAERATMTSWLTEERVLMMNNMSATLAGISGLFCLVVLGIVAVLYSRQETRKALDRLSFRLLVYALVADISYIICVKVSGGFWCVAGPWLIQFWLGVANWFILCIALNLQLVLVHSVDGLMLEKWYIIVPIALNLAISLPPLIKGKFGWDPVIGVCWLTDHSVHNRLVWQIATQLLWIVLAEVITMLCAGITIAHLYKHKFTSLKVIKRDSSHQSSHLSNNSNGKGNADFHANLARRTANNLTTQRGFRNVIVRISLYPIVMTIVNMIITIGDIRISTAGIHTSEDYYLYAVYYGLYGARGIFYAIMAVLDPSFMRAIRIYRGETLDSSHHSQSCTDTGAGISVHTETRFEEEFASPSRGGIDVEMQPVGLRTNVVGGSGANNININNNNNNSDDARHTHWGAESDVSVDSRIKESPDEEDTSSIADLTNEAQGDRIQEIRGQQKERARMRHEAEREFKRQI
ncbi:hypothetical protein BZA05DRAFT_440447 [Tricharina praecox]|uniref:uncharacterized protein n=1 Tax=Tricharina praecox TaxID=43433 RepID=UPI0022202E08|nr:uncharacterized protein BZA05DRAFT_440447 [Tricharina praecox]KAI5858827.1 hypothetical protein BZA05DRAFT_440447 [Tricharina praecox]